MNENYKILIISNQYEEYSERISKMGLRNLECFGCASPDEAESRIGSADIILGEPPIIASLLDRAGNLKWVQSTFAGVEALMGPSSRKDYLLTGVKGVFGPIIGEYVFGYIIAIERGFFEMRANQARKKWETISYESLFGKRLGVCGTGSIGKHIARTANHFGMTVWGYKNNREKIEGIERVFTPSEFEYFLSKPDYIVITLPDTVRTSRLFDEKAFRNMKKKAVLINVGRGSVVSEPALLQALEKGEIAGAVLDVFETEPLDEKSELWDRPEVIITPHLSGFSFPKDIAAIFAENYARFIRGQPLKYRVDFQKGY